MIKKLLREFYLLPRGEQRALLLLSVLLTLSLGARLIIAGLPSNPPADMDEFLEEAHRILASMEWPDTIRAYDKGDTSLYSRPAVPGSRPSYSRQTVLPVDINRADSVTLLPLPGIGPVFAGRIIRYRDLLGGFFEVNQLNEVYGMPEETVELIRDKIVIDTMIVRKILLNSAEFKELLRHPYLEYDEVRAILNFRDFTGEIRSISELRENHILPDSTLERVSFYFDHR